jgi:hypothetical protein
MITDFSEYTTGQPPSDWTEQWQTASITLSVVEGEGDGKTLYLDLATSGHRVGCSWDDLGSIRDVEILCKIKTKASTDYAIGPAVRLSGGSGAESGYGLWMNDGANYFRLRRYVAGSGSVDLATLNLAIVNGNYYWVRFRAEGADFKIKAWADGGSEPALWGTEYTDPTPYLTVGGVGLITYNTDGWCDYFSADEIIKYGPFPTHIQVAE